MQADHPGREPRMPRDQAPHYERPRIEAVLTDEELEREVIYAGNGTII